MGERAGLHCKRHGKWCPSGTCDDCTAMAVDASKTIADNVGHGAAMCEQAPLTIFDPARRSPAPFDGLLVKIALQATPPLGDEPYRDLSREPYTVGVDPGRDEGSVRAPLTAEETRAKADARLANIDKPPAEQIDAAEQNHPWLPLLLKPRAPSIVEALMPYLDRWQRAKAVRDTAPAEIRKLAAEDPLVSNYLDAMALRCALWSAEESVMLIVLMSKRDAERAKQLQAFGVSYADIE